VNSGITGVPQVLSYREVVFPSGWKLRLFHARSGFVFRKRSFTYIFGHPPDRSQIDSGQTLNEAPPLSDRVVFFSR